MKRRRKKEIVLEKISLYQFKDFDMDKFVQKYLHEVNPHEESDGDIYGFHTILTEKKNGIRKEEGIRWKCQYLQDVIIRKAHRKINYRTFSLNSNILKSVIGNEYKTMLDILRQMGYIELGDGYHGAEKTDYYVEGRYSMLYTMKDVDYCQTKPFVNKKIQIYEEKTLKEIDKLHKKYVDEVIAKKYGMPFLDRYNCSLNYIRIKDAAGLDDFVEKRKQMNPKSKAYYDCVMDGLRTSHKQIEKVDDSNRFYHVLTNMKREIKKFLTIDFTLDCKNSHPLLFNYFIFASKGISANRAYALTTSLNSSLYSTLGSLNSFSSSFSPSISYHKHGEKLFKSLKDSDLKKNGFAQFSDDELEYIYKTSNGILWDELTEWTFNNPSVIEKWKGLEDENGKKLYPELSETDGDDYKKTVRSVLKAEMFRQTFYSHSSKKKKDYDIGKEFARRYPNVFRLIGEWKKKKNAQAVEGYMRKNCLPYKESSSLSIAMMGLESKIFTRILKRLYAKRWNAVHIHDCIVIPEDGNNNHPTKEQVKKIMLDVYKSFGLCPTFD